MKPKIKVRNPVAKAMLEDEYLKPKVVQSKKKKYERINSKELARRYTEHTDKEEDWDR